MTSHRTEPRQRAVVVLLAALLLGGCASANTGQAAGGTTSTPGGHPGRTVSLDEHAAGTTVSVPAGATVLLVLHSTYWGAPHSSAVGLLQPLGAATSSAAAVGPSCHPGSGCGSVSSRFLALNSSGSAALTSSRTSCGEAMPCPPGKRDFTVTIVVTSPS